MPFDLARYHVLRTSKRVGAEVRFRERTQSTMDDAREGAASGGPSGAAYVAGEQLAGRGRMGRTWLSAASVGLYVTYHLRTRDARHAPLYALAGALAASDAILATSGLRTVLKWPNDVLEAATATRKLCGVLAESRPAAPGDIDVFLGIGTNVRAAPLPPEIEGIATSIEAAGGAPPDLEALLASLSASLEHWSDHLEREPAAVVESWRERLVTLGRRVRLLTPTGPVEGEAVDVSPLGELVLRLEDGRTEAFAAGDVTTLR